MSKKRMTSRNSQKKNGSTENLTESNAVSQQTMADVKSYLIALRPWSFTASFTPVALGSALAYKSVGEFSIIIFLVTLLTALAVHAAGNLVNTYFDYIQGIDGKASDDRTLVDKILDPPHIAWLGALFYTIGVVGCAVLYFMSTARSEHLALIFFCGMSSSFLYTGGLGLKYMALGDILIFLTFGPITVMFSYLAQAGQLSVMTLIYTVPLALNTEAILHANNTRDMEPDRKAKIVTVAILLGKKWSYLLFVLLMFVPYIMFVVGSLHISSWMLLPVITIVEAFRIEKQFRAENLMDVPQQIAKLNFLMGVLFVLSVALADKAAIIPTLDM